VPSRTPRVDASAGWRECGRPRCGIVHDPEYPCPPRGVWLVYFFTTGRTAKPRHLRAVP
jgi:hypothetical protein